MLEKEGVALKAIRWSEIFPWLSIGKSFRLAIGPRPLVFGAAALLLTLGGWYTIAYVFRHDDKLNDSWARGVLTRSRFGKSSIMEVLQTGNRSRPIANVRTKSGSRPLTTRCRRR